MKNLFVTAAVLMIAMSGAHAQIAAPPVPSMLPPPPAPPAPPPPRIEVPQVPKMDAPPKQPQAAPARRSSYHDRVLACLDDATSVRLAPGERVAYSRSCANQAD